MVYLPVIKVMDTFKRNIYAYLDPNLAVPYNYRNVLLKTQYAFRCAKTVWGHSHGT